MIDKVTDDEILYAYKQVAACEGIFVEPACAAPIAGLHKLARQGYFTQPITAVAIFTGHGLKDPDRAIGTSGKIVELGANRDDLLRALNL